MKNGTNPLALFDELRALEVCTTTARTDALPRLADLDTTCCHLSWEVILAGDVCRDAIDDVFIFVMDDMELAIEPLSPVEAVVGEAVEGTATVVAELRVMAELPEEATTANVERVVSTKAGESVRVPAERLDMLMGRVGELVIAQSRLSQGTVRISVCGRA